MGKSTITKWPLSIATLNYQRVSLLIFTSLDFHGILPTPASDHHHADLVLLSGGDDLHGVVQDDVHELVITCGV